MNGTQRKFLLVSAVAHGVLMVLLIVGPAFMPKRESPLVNTPVLHVIPSDLVMQSFVGGGTPTPKPLPTPPEPEQSLVVDPDPSPATPDPPKPEPTPSKIEKPPEIKTTAKPRAEPAPKREVKPPPQKIQVQSTKIMPREADTAREAREREAAEERQRREAAAAAMEKRFASALGDLKKNLPTSTGVSIPGPGGPAVANYDAAVQTLYYQNWLPPSTLADERAEVVAEVQVNHDGRVLRDRIITPSGNRALDDSVQAALDRVRARGLPKFPSEMKTQGQLQKTYRIKFDLRSKLRLQQG